VSILRRPGNDGIATWGRVMHDLGYQTSFLYGGYGYFDDMNAFYAGNGFAVLDRSDIEHPGSRTSRGVSDEDLRPRDPAFSSSTRGTSRSSRS
jgi:phosphoglycerol transferase MdoB-like AlkP superfamily enzyme